MKAFHHFIFLLILHFALQTTAIAASSSSDQSHRRILHQPLFPASSSPPPTDSSSSLPPPPPSTPTTPDQPFFHELPSGQGSSDQSQPQQQQQSPPSSSSNEAVPIPSATQPTKPIKKFAIAISVGIVTLGMLSALAFFLYRHRAKHPSEPHKLVVGEGSSLSRAVEDSRAAPPSSFLYIGTVEPSRASSNEASGELAPANKSPYRKLNPVKRSDRYRPSPELQPLPPLVKPPLPQQRTASPSYEDDEDEESRDTAFHSPQSSSFSYDDSYFYTPISRQSSNGNGFGNSNGNGNGSTSVRSFAPPVAPVPHSKRTSPKSRFSNQSTKQPPPPPPPPPPLPPPAAEVVQPKLTAPQYSWTNLARQKSTQNSPPQRVAGVSVPPPPPPPLPPPPVMWSLKPVPTVSLKPAQSPPPPQPWKSVPKTVYENRTVKSEQKVQNDNSKVAADSSDGLDAAEETAEDSGGAKPKLKPLHWDKVRATSDRATVWDQLKASSFQLNEDMMESLFGCNSTNSAQKESTTRRSVLPPAEQENRVLDPKKSQNIAILLRALNVTRDEVSEALLDGNPEGLGPELLETLVKMAPTKEEEIKLREYDGDSSKLGSAERFLKAVLDIPSAFKRVEAMLYRANFDTEVKYLRKSFQTLEEASEELKNSRLFLKLLEAVLRTGNRMNVGTNRGDAKSFKLDTLLKLVDIKGTDGKTTLLHFVVQEIIRSEGTVNDSKIENVQSQMKEEDFRKQGLKVVAGLSRDLNNVKKSAGMDSDVLSSYVTKLETGLEKVRSVLQLEKKSDKDGKFFDSMKAFLKGAEEEIERVKADERNALFLVKEATEYFHGDVAKEEAHPFRIFMIVRDFLSVLDQVCKEVGKMQEVVIGSARSFRISSTASLPVLNRYNVRNDTSSDDESLSP